MSRISTYNSATTYTTIGSGDSADGSFFVSRPLDVTMADTGETAQIDAIRLTATIDGVPSLLAAESILEDATHWYVANQASDSAVQFLKIKKSDTTIVYTHTIPSFDGIDIAIDNDGCLYYAASGSGEAATSWVCKLDEVGGLVWQRSITQTSFSGGMKVAYDSSEAQLVVLRSNIDESGRWSRLAAFNKDTGSVLWEREEQSSTMKKFLAVHNGLIVCCSPQDDGQNAELYTYNSAGTPLKAKIIEDIGYNIDARIFVDDSAIYIVVTGNVEVIKMDHDLNIESVKSIDASPYGYGDLSAAVMSDSHLIIGKALEPQGG